MLNIPEVIKELFLQDGVRKNFRVHFPNGERADLVNKDIIEESVKFTESTCSQQTLRFGLTEASVIEFECVGVENIAGMTIECGIEIDVSRLSRADRQAYGTRTDDVPFPFYAVPYGVFVVDKCPRQADMKRRKVTGYTSLEETMLYGQPTLCKMQQLYITASAYIEALKTRAGTFEDMWRSGTSLIGYNSNGNTGLYFYKGVYFRKFQTRSIKITDLCVIRYDFKPAQMDALSTQLYKTAIQSMPSGSYIYNANILGVYREFIDMTTAPAIALACFMPFIRVSYNYFVNDQIQTYRCYPRILTSTRGSIIINPLEDIRGYGNVGTPNDYIVEVFIPEEWTPEVFWEINRGPGNVDLIPVQGWPIQERQTRPGEISVKYAHFSAPAGSTNYAITPTSKTMLPGVGQYYEFTDAMPEEDAANDILNIAGLFGNIMRTGGVDIKPLERTNAYRVLKKSIESLWYDEEETQKIGGALYKYYDGTDEQEGEIIFDSKDTKTYNLTENKLLKQLQDRSQAGIEAAILEYFPQNVSEAFYTPIDIKMKGLPFLEDGDAIQIDLENGEIVDSYILRRTISGVQHLIDEIEAQGEV